MRLAIGGLALMALVSIGCGGGGHGGGGGVASVTTLAIPSGMTEPRGVAARQNTDALFFTAFTTQGVGTAPVVVTMTKEGGSALTLATGGISGTTGVLVEPVAMVLSKHESTLFVADAAAVIAAGDTTAGAIFSLPVAGGTPTVLSHGTVDTPTGLALSSDGLTLFVSGRDAKDGQATIFAVATAGGATTELVKGAPLTAVTGIAASADGTKLFVADQNRLNTADAQVYVMSPSGGSLTALAPNGISVSTSSGEGVIERGDGNVVVSSRNGDLAQLTNVAGSNGAVSTRFQGAPLLQPFGLSKDGGTLYVADGAIGGTGAIVKTN